MMKYIVTIDIGTTSVKVGLFDHKLNRQSFVSMEYILLTPEKEHIEMQPHVYWDTITLALKKIIESGDVSGQDIDAIAICSQGETLIPIDNQGKVLRNAIVWIDSRAKTEAEYLSKIIGDDTYYQTTGLSGFGPADPICKLLWIKRNEPALYDRTDKFLLLTDYIGFLLTGELLSEETMMSSTGYYDINKNRVWSETLETALLDQSKIPTVVQNGFIAGKIKHEIAQSIGLSDDVKIIIAGSDQICSAVGGGNIMPGTVTETTGTALVIAATVDKPNYQDDQKIITYKHTNGKYLIMPYVNTASIILKWFKDEFCVYEAVECEEKNTNVYKYLDEIAASVTPLANGLMLYPQFSGKNSPDLNPKTKGAFFNVGLDTKKRHFVRAIFEGVAYMLKENIQALEKSGLQISEIRSLGGGSRSDVWNQIKADILDKPIITFRTDESTSLGVAIIGSVSLNWYQTLSEAIDSTVVFKKKYHPNKENVAKYQRGYEFYLELDRTFKKLFDHEFYV